MKHFLTSLLLIASLAVSATPMSSGRWVKIRVNETGAYQLTDAELQALGFSDPAAVRVYGFAPTLLLTHDTDKIPADLTAIPSVHENGKLAFYAQTNVDYNAEFWDTTSSVDALNHNRLSSTRGATYFLSDQGSEAILPQLQASAPTGNELTSHDCVIFHEQDLTNPGSAGSVFGGEVIADRNARLPFTVTLTDVGSGSGRLLMQSLMLSSSSTNNHLVAIYPEGWSADDSTGNNGTQISSTNHVVFGISRRHQLLTLPAADQPTDHEIIITPNPSIANGFSRGYLDYWALIYDRRNNLAGQSQLTMHFPKPANDGFSLSGLEGAGWHVWDVTNPADIRECMMQKTDAGSFVGKYAQGSAKAPAAVVAFNTAATLLSPEIVGHVANQDLHSLAVPDMVIVTSPLLMSAAQEAARVHASCQGLDVAVVSQEEIFNEFGSGNISAEAVRLFLRHLWLQSPDKLKAVMLVGPATVDNAKNIHPDSPSVITFQQESQKLCEKTTSNFFADIFLGHLGDMQDSSDKPIFKLLKSPQTIAVGRLPWSDVATICGYMAKVEDYLTNPPVVPVMASVLSTSDLTKNATDDRHYNDSENCIAKYDDKVGGDVTITRLHPNFYSTANNTMTRKWLKSTLSRGCDLMVYFGHGASNQIGGSVSSADYLLDLGKAGELANSGTHTFGFFGSCNISQYDTKNQTLATELVGNPHGGLIGLMACCREGYLDENPNVGKPFVEFFANAPDGTYIGNVVKSVFDSLDGSNKSLERYSNHLCYGYTGDPALPLYRPTLSMTLDPIEALHPGVANTISGTIDDESFSGTAIITIYDAPETRANKVADSAGVTEMVMDHTPLLQVPAEVKNGRFTATFNGPGFSENYSDETGIRITAYAYSADKRQRAMTHAKGIIVTEAPADASPIIYSTPAEITEFYVQDAEIDGSLSGRVLLHAEISAPDGLNVGTAGFSPAHLSIDGKSKSDATRAMRFVSPGHYELDYLAAEMGDGRHEATLDIVGLDGQITSRTIEFSTNGVASATADVVVGESGELKVEFSASNIDKSFVCVESLSGQMIRRIETTEQSVSIDDLPAGIYRVYTQHEGATTHTSSPKVIVTI